MEGQWNDKIFSVSSRGFNELALEIFHFQYARNPVYRQYTDSLKVVPGRVRSVTDIPFLPIRFFKSYNIITGSFEPAVVFESSGTTGTVQSRHLVKDEELYKESFTRWFESVYGKISDWCILGLLPSYLERKNSSLVYMVNELIRLSGHTASGFYLDEFEKLGQTIITMEQQRQKTLLIGVTFALLDFADYFRASINQSLQFTSVMETGGMKGRKKEIVRPEVHSIIKECFGIPFVHSEYGMTELLSQAYSTANGLFNFPSWAKLLIREEDDPLEVHDYNTAAQPIYTGAVNIVDLANIHSCSFIATDDAGRLYPNGSFEIIGRLDNSDLRGCSLMTV